MPTPTPVDDASDALARAVAAIEAGEALIACDLLADARVRFPQHRELAVRHALALARSGATARARAVLHGLHRDGYRTTQTLGLLARTAKDAALDASAPAERKARFQEASRLYADANAIAPDGWTAINAASMAAAAGDAAEARRLAADARTLMGKTAGGDYWHAATLAEAALLLGELDEARAQYKQAVHLAGKRWGSIAAMRRNARLLLGPLGVDESFLECLALPGVASFSADAVATLVRGDIGFAYLVPASEREVGLGEAVLAKGADLHLVLPCDVEPFLAEQSAPLRARVQALLAAAERVHAVSKTRIGGAVSDRYARAVARGLAHIRAAQLGSASIVIGKDDEPAAARREGEARILSFLFCDTLGYSKLADAEVALYLRHFLGGVGMLLAECRPAPVARNTWGDAVYVAFETAAQAARFSMVLREKIAQADWTTAGLPADLTLRIALHAGPAFDITDPITGAPNVFGAHVSRTARLEPVTPPGEVYASEAFAALAAAECAELAFEYVGQLPLAKGFGTYPTYHVRTRG